MDDLTTLASLGLELPTPSYLFGLILFGVIGFAAYRHGRKAALPKIKWTGVAMMLYPYVVSTTWLLYGIGGLLCIALFVFRKAPNPLDSSGRERDSS